MLDDLLTAVAFASTVDEDKFEALLPSMGDAVWELTYQSRLPSPRVGVLPSEMDSWLPLPAAAEAKLEVNGAGIVAIVWTDSNRGWYLRNCQVRGGYLRSGGESRYRGRRVRAAVESVTGLLRRMAGDLVLRVIDRVRRDYIMAVYPA